MISKTAVKEFLSRPTESFEWIKALSDADLDAELDALGIEFRVELYRHQKEMLIIGAYTGSFLFFADMGLGKTATALYLYDYLHRSGAKSALVCVQNLVNIDNWVREAEIHVPHLRVVPLYGSTEDRFATLASEEADIYIINYAGLVHMFSFRADDAKGNKKSFLDNDLIDAFGVDIDVLICDESQNIKNHQSLSYRICNRLGLSCAHRFGMTGTPFGDNPQDLWSQFYLVDRGETLGKTLTLFREAFFTKKKNYWGGYEYNFHKRMVDTLHERIQNRSLRYDSDDCLDLPPRKIIIQSLPFPQENHDYYLKILEMIKVAGNNVAAMDNAYVKMIQLTSGYLTVKGEDSTKIEVEFDNKPKLDALLQLIDELPEGRKLVVFHEFIATGSMISKALKANKIKHVWLYGGTKDKKGTLAKFLDDPTVKVLVVNNQSGGTGLNLQVANYMVMFEMPRSTLLHAQVLKRLHRSGQTRTTFVYYLLMKKSIDYARYKAWTEGKELFDVLISTPTDKVERLLSDV